MYAPVVEKNLGMAVSHYNRAKDVVISHGFQDEIDRLATLRLEDVTEQKFLYQIAYVILESGFNSATVRNKFPLISDAFYNFESAGKIIEHKDEVLANALKAINNKSKIEAIIKSAERVNKYGWEHIKAEIQIDSIDSLRKFPYIGPITVYHLAKYLGANVAKPDRHLVRIARLYGYISADDNTDVQNNIDVQKFCQDISKQTGDSVPIVDTVWWYYATIDTDYINTLSLPV
jgi:thermostable 8-oxoguanine DNA glycosylase